MITNLYIKNFKSLKEVNLELRPLNLLTGLNGSGKSSLIQVLLLLRQSRYNLQFGQLKLNEPNSGDSLFNAGVGEDIYYYYGIEPHIIFQLVFSDQISYPFGYNYVREKDEYADYLHTANTYKAEQVNTYALFNNNFQYLFADRELPKDLYPASVENVINKKTLGFKGEHTAFYLQTFGTEKRIKHPALLHRKAKDENLIFQINAWLAEISPDVSVETKLVNDSQNVQLKYKYGVKAFKPKNVGFGLSYVLPVVTALLTAEAGKLIIIENPESHIHPRGQAELGRLIAAAAQTGAQLIIETHSDHILNGIRVAVKEGLASSDSVMTYYFKRNEEDSSSNVASILIDEKGKLCQKMDNGLVAQLPKGFFDEWKDAMFKLV